MKTTINDCKLPFPEIDGQLLILVKVFVKFRNCVVKRYNKFYRCFVDPMSDHCFLTFVKDVNAKRSSSQYTFFVIKMP